MRKIAFILVGVVLLFASFSLFGGTTAFIEPWEMPESTHPLDLLINEKVVTLSTDTMKFTVSNSSRYGGGSLLEPYSVRIYDVTKRTKIEDVERDFLEVFPRVLKVHNDIPEIRPYLTTYPVTSKDMGISLKYGPKPGIYYALPYYCIAMNWPHNNIIEFRRMERPDHPGMGNQPGVDKSMWDFPALVELKNLGIPRSKEEKIAPIIVDKATLGAVNTPSCYVTILRDLCTRYGLHRAAFTHCALGKWKWRPVSSGFWAQNNKMGLEEVRVFAEKFIEDYLGQIRQKKVVEKSLNKDSPEFKDIKENLNWFCFRITFWDEWLNRVEEPYIAQIQCQDGKILYFTADEGQRLKQVFEEPVPQRFFPQGKS